ncbi:hypothetical protein EXIGLDRAFT_767754 [Exidia glandulosa HHB12029]|uniref:Ima1 N-terminal domain-containing protein n=1 Tax=Exidia glandulosa HHB12029 TaxID=1314781 RepID=A0A165IRH0_EXIGL|nr:hypothetical protein EXIGLDRAFT_767754 [Exidia glandulosa HHB12029]
MFLRKPAAASCFYCLSVQNPAPRDPTAFKCTECATWNRFSRSGEILSDEPAMHDASLNTVNFARRGSPSKTSLPSSFATSVFCRACQTNQTLLLNLLSNYLPDSEDPTYAAMLEQFPAYKESLHQRYPPVCRNCQANVDDELQKKNYMARTSALGSRLKETRRMETVRAIKPDLPRDVLVWRLRGALWLLTQVSTVSLLALGILDRLHVVFLSSPAVALAVTLLSFSWMFWDPTWHTVRRTTLAGQRIRVLGRPQYIRYQLIAWLSRLIVCVVGIANVRSLVTVARPRPWLVTALIIDLTCLALSLLSLRIQRPTPIRLIDTSRYQKAQEAPPPSVDADPEPLLSALSLAPQPIIPKLPAPVFGQTSTPQAPASLAQVDDDEMDWTPTGPNAEAGDSWLHPQRFFAPEQPTGLEALLERTTIRDETGATSTSAPAQSSSSSTPRRWLIYGTAMALVIAFLWAAMERGQEPVYVRPSLRSEQVRMPATNAYAHDRTPRDPHLHVPRREI